tara:strand:- start:2787 stop:3092 length:306 start_codon:yes stop_codon:yes gene_type:complete
MSSEILSNIFGVIGQTLLIYSYLLIIRVLLTWFPNLDWSNPILANLSAITDPYLNIFRGLIPPIAGIDISPILAFLLLNFVQNFVSYIRFASLNNAIQFYN